MVKATKKMKIVIVVLSVCYLVTVHGYEYGPITDRILLYKEEFTSYNDCLKNISVIRHALETNQPLPNTPTQPITSANVSFLLYTRRNPEVPVILQVKDPVEEFKSSGLDVELETIFYVPGYNTSTNSSSEQFPSSLLPRKNVNIFIVDWYSYSVFELYYTSTVTVNELSKIIARFLKKIVAIGVNRKKVVLTGQSLGSQAIGLAGKLIYPKVGRIAAFDPAGYCFNFLPSGERISKTDADYVQIVHCSVGRNGLRLGITGDVTFYMNGGFIQPQCENQTDLDTMNLCSHVQCAGYLYDSLKANDTLVGFKCPTYVNYLANQCNCFDRVRLTYDVPTSIRGSYYVDTVPRKACDFLK